MARDLENESYYISRGGKIPIKWSPPEVYTQYYSQGMTCSWVARTQIALYYMHHYLWSSKHGTVYRQYDNVYLQALNFKKYTTASDVWSYGIVMYEIWSLGHKPYEGYTNPQVSPP